MEEGDNTEAWKGLRKAIVALEEEGGWIKEEDRMMTITERVNDVGEDMKNSSEDEHNDGEVRANMDKDDLKNDDERLVTEYVKSTEKGDGMEAGVNMDNLEDPKNDSGGSDQSDNGEMKSDEILVVGGAKRKRKEGGLGSEQGEYGKRTGAWRLGTVSEND